MFVHDHLEHKCSIPKIFVCGRMTELKLCKDADQIYNNFSGALD
jgi:hypothetical protein